MRVQQPLRELLQALGHGRVRLAETGGVPRRARQAVLRAEPVRDSDAVQRVVHHLDGVPRAEVAVLDHAQVRTRAVGLREPAHPALLAEPAAEGLAGRAGLRDLQQGRADPPVLTDHGAVHVQAADPQVLAEQPRRDLAVQLGAPVVGVLLGVGVDRLVEAAVAGAVGLHVRVQAVGPHLDPPLHGTLVDRRDAHGAGIRMQDVHATDREELSHAVIFSSGEHPSDVSDVQVTWVTCTSDTCGYLPRGSGSGSIHWSSAVRSIPNSPANRIRVPARTPSTDSSRS